MTRRADQLLAGPRGRRLCAELLVGPDGGLGPPWHWQLTVSEIAPARARDDVRAALAATDLTTVAEHRRLHDALLAAVDSTRYWQEPFEVDRVLADDTVAQLLRPVAEAVAAAPASGWWAEPLSRRRFGVPVVVVCPECGPAEAQQWIGAGDEPELACSPTGGRRLTRGRGPPVRTQGGGGPNSSSWAANRPAAAAARK